MIYHFGIPNRVPISEVGKRQPGNSRFPFDSFAALSPSGQALTGPSNLFGMTSLSL